MGRVGDRQGMTAETRIQLLEADMDKVEGEGVAALVAELNAFKREVRAELNKGNNRITAMIVLFSTTTVFAVLNFALGRI